MLAAERLAKYIRAQPGFELVTEMDGQYGHMGATLADAVLQAGVKYETVVRPRIQRLMREFPHANTTSAFKQLLQQRGAPEILQWSGGRKLETLAALIELLLSEELETEEDLREWIREPENLARLRKIKGIKDKTAHYLQILLGVQSVAVDRHLFRFLADGGLPTTSYEEAHGIIRDAAKILGVDASLLDHSIWRHMSTRPAVRIDPTPTACDPSRSTEPGCSSR